MISILLVDDDMNKIISIINSIKQNFKDYSIEVKQASSAQEAIEILKINDHFHLLITDLFMPIKDNESPDKKGGEHLIKSLYKAKYKINIPIYIVGLSQIEDAKENFSKVWNVWNYDANQQDWRDKLRDLIFHIRLINHKIIKQKIETLFVEGITDKEIINISLNLFYPFFVNKITIETKKNSAGASWVERQLIIWAKTLFWKDMEEKKYLKAIGLFDDDEASKKAIDNIKTQIAEDSAEFKTFSILKLKYQYAPHLVELYKQGIQLPITLEELYSPCCWKYAQENNWLVPRPTTELQCGEMISNKLENINVSKETLLYVNFKVKKDDKQKFVQHIKTLPQEEQEVVLCGVKFLLKDILLKLKLLAE